MRILIQRVKSASVNINNEIHSSISKGLLILVGIEEADNQEDIDWLCKKASQLRIFDDEKGVMNLSVKDINGEVLIVSQFTLQAKTAKGNRPSYIKAAKPEISIPLYEKFCANMQELIEKEVKMGVFGADMQISLINDGPVTIWMDSKERDY